MNELVLDKSFFCSKTCHTRAWKLHTAVVKNCAKAWRSHRGGRAPNSKREGMKRWCERCSLSALRESPKQEKGNSSLFSAVFYEASEKYSAGPGLCLGFGRLFAMKWSGKALGDLNWRLSPFYWRKCVLGKWLESFVILQKTKQSHPQLLKALGVLIFGFLFFFV